MDHQEWDDLPDEPLGHEPDGETADLGADGGPHDPLGAGDLGAGDFGFDDLSPDLGDPGDQGPGLPGGPGAFDTLDEPLGTEDAAADYDAGVAPAEGSDPAGSGPADVDGSDVEDASAVDGDGPGDPVDPWPDADPWPDPDLGPLASELGAPDLDNPELGDPTSVVGADPDVDPTVDDGGWDDSGFPPELGLTDPPTPVDGFPWTDVAALGDGSPDDPIGGDAAPPATDLASYDGTEIPDGADAWTALIGSEDPATSTLARFWEPR